MEIFLVVTHSTTGPDERVFSCPKAAFSYIRKHGQANKPKMLEIPVIGELETPDTVYTVNWFDRTNDTHNVESMYGNYYEAKRAVGDHGQVLRREIRMM